MQRATSIWKSDALKSTTTGIKMPVPSSRVVAFASFILLPQLIIPATRNKKLRTIGRYERGSPGIATSSILTNSNLILTASCYY